MGWSDLGLIFLGWLLGLLSPVIQNYILTRRKKKQVEKLIEAEVSELAKQLVVVSFLLSESTFSLTKDFVKWCLQEYERLDTGADEFQIKERLERFVQNSAQQLDEYNTKQSLGGFSPVGVKRYEMPYSLAHANFFHNLEQEKQSAIWEVANRLNTFNQEVDQLREYRMMTFDESISNANHEIIKAELVAKSNYLSRYCKTIIAASSKVLHNNAMHATSA